MYPTASAEDRQTSVSLQRFAELQNYRREDVIPNLDLQLQKHSANPLPKTGGTGIIERLSDLLQYHVAHS